MRRTIALLLLLLLASAGANATEVAAFLRDGALAARIDAMNYPATLPNDLTSGLTNRLYARMSLFDGDDMIRQHAVEFTIRYDLWDEKFSVVRSMDGKVIESRSLATLAEVQAFLAALPLPRLFDTAGLPATRALVLRAELLLNPIDLEKMRMIRKWVAQNSTPQVGEDQGISMSNALFNRIFEQYADGSKVAAVWRADVASAPFRIDALSHERF